MYKNGHLTYRNRYKIVPKSSKLPPRSLQKSPLEPCMEASWAPEASKTALGANKRPPEGKNQVRGSLLGPQVGLQKSVFGVKNRENWVLKVVWNNVFILKPLNSIFVFVFWRGRTSKMSFSRWRGVFFCFFGFSQVKPQEMRSDLDFGGHLGKVLAGFCGFWVSKMSPAKWFKTWPKKSCRCSRLYAGAGGAP